MHGKSYNGGQWRFIATVQSGATENFPGRLSEINFEEWWWGGGCYLDKDVCRSRDKEKLFQTKRKESLSHQHNFNLLGPHTLPQYQNKSSWRIMFWLIKTLIAYISMICSSITNSQNVLPLHSQTQGSLLICLFSVYFLQHSLNILPKVHFLFLFNFRYCGNI